MSMKVEAVTEPISLGEGPHWDIPSQTLYFIDIRKGSVHSYKPETKKHFTAVIGDGTLPVSLIVPIEGQKDKFVISIKNELATITWDGKSSTTSKPEKIASFETSLPENRINDGKCDTEGRLWAGTMGSRGQDGTFAPVGAFYSFSKNNNIKKHLENITCSNGLTWSVDNKKLYHIDSFKYCVDSFEYDAETETLSNRKTIFDFKKNNLPGIPDGMTIDTKGILYVANYDGCQVLLIEPETGKLISKIPIPAKQVTSVAFGGPNLDELYVTSANLDPVTDLASNVRNGTCGCLFKVTNLCAKGLPMTNIKL